MAEYMKFETAVGKGVVLDIDAMLVCWEGVNPGCTVLILLGVDDPIEVLIDWKTFVNDWLDVYVIESQPKPKKKPRTKARGSSSSTPAKLEASA